MSCCTGRCLLIALCCLQLISTAERQVFEFLGYMWGPIIGNFLNIIFIIIGLFGACQYRHRILVVYCVWCIIWLIWNAFVICFYLEVGMLSREMPILNIGTGNKSWWTNIGCQNISTSIDVMTLVTSGCLLQYYYVEVIHAGIQFALTMLSFCTACYVVYVFTAEEDTRFWESEPVLNELEYIRMRYQSPARHSFRGANKTYENLTVRSDCTITTGDGTFRPLQPATDPLSDKTPIALDVTKTTTNGSYNEVIGMTTPLTAEQKT